MPENNLVKLKYLCKSFSTPIIQQELQAEGKYKVYGASGLAGYIDSYAVSEPYLGIVKDGAGVGRISCYEAYSSLLGTLSYIVPNADVDITWLKFVIMSLNLGKDVGKTTIPHIYFSEYGNRSVPLISNTKQRKIADILNRKCAEIDAVIERTKATIEEYKKLKRSIITEAVTKGIRGNRPMKESGIEWIGEMPTEWSMTKLSGATLSMRNGYVGPTRDLFFEDGVRYIQSLHIKNGKIDFDRHPYYVSDEWAEVHPKIKTNDILIVQTGDIGQVGIVEDKYDGCNCHALIIATPNSDVVIPNYLKFYLMSFVGRELMLSFRTGALLPHLNAGKIKFTPVVVPSLHEQEEIAEYLAKKCAEIDALIGKKMVLLKELEEYKESVIYEYVTGKKEVV